MTPDPVYFLLVDDLEENLLALDGVLRRDGLVLLRARSGPEALEHLLRFDVALALVDVRMPGMSGFELAELMRGADRTRRVPIIFLTAGDEDRTRRFRGYEAGAVDFLHKPIETDVLRSKAGVFFELARQRGEITRLLAESRGQAEALRQQDRRKDEFLATLAHELRNPLAPIRTAVEVLRHAPADHPKAAAARDVMDRQLAHMVRLIDDLLDVSRVSEGKITLKPERVAAAAVAEAAVEGSRPALDAAGHTFTAHLPDAPLWLHADPVRVAQMVSNLLTNAAKYTPDGGRVDLTVTADGPDVLFRVADTGTGIPADMLPKVFDLFTQVGRTLDRSQGGLGIGLSLVKRLAEMHGGSVTAESGGAGKGSTFTLRLPAVRNADVGMGKEGTPSAHAGGAGGGAGADPPDRNSPLPTPHSAWKKVLIVDDNVDGADSLASLLSLIGHDARTAHNGPAALGVVADFRPQVVVLDIGMPGMNGYEVARRVRAATGPDCPTLVALTGWGAEEDRRQSREAGFDHHLTKPVDPAELARLCGR